MVTLMPKTSKQHSNEYATVANYIKRGRSDLHEAIKFMEEKLKDESNDSLNPDEFK